MRRRVAVLLALVLVGVVLPESARAETPSPKTPDIETVPAAILRLLDDYGRAYQTKDRDLLAGTLGSVLKGAELKAFDNAKDVPFRSFRVEATTQFSGNLAYGRVRDLYQGKDVRNYQVTERSELDVESIPYEEDGAFTFVRDGARPGDRYDGWRLESKADLDILGFFSPYHPWDAGPVSLLRSTHFVLLTHPEVLDEMRPVIELAERAYARATSFWPRRVDQRYVIVVPATTEELGALFHATIDLQKFVAFVSAGSDQTDGWRPTGPRLFIHLSHLRNYGAAGQLEIIAHELLHAITRPVSGPHIPVWVEEGLANAGGGTGGRPSLARTGPVPDAFPTDEQFVTGPVEQIMTRYDQAMVAIQTLVDEFGHEGLARFYERLGSARIVPGVDRYYVRRAIVDALHWTEDAWLAAWRERLK